MRKPEDTALIDRELAALEEALALGEPTAPDRATRELQELGLLLREDAPEPEPAFAARLGARVRAGFPRRRRLPQLRRPPTPVLAGAGAVLLAGAVAVPLTRNGGGGGAGTRGGGGGGPGGPGPAPRFAG